MSRMSCAWIWMSLEVPPKPPEGWCISTRAFGRGVALALGAAGEQELSHRGGHADADRDDVVRDELHRVVDGHAGGDRAARRVDVEVDVLLRVLGGEQQHLRADRVRVVVAHLRAEPDDALFQQPVVDARRDKWFGHVALLFRWYVASNLPARPTSTRPCSPWAEKRVADDDEGARMPQHRARFEVTAARLFGGVGLLWCGLALLRPELLRRQRSPRPLRPR